MSSESIQRRNDSRSMTQSGTSTVTDSYVQVTGILPFSDALDMCAILTRRVQGRQRCCSGQAIRVKQAEARPPQQEVGRKQGHFVVALVGELGTQVWFCGVGRSGQGGIVADVIGHLRRPPAVAVNEVLSGRGTQARRF